MMKRSWRRAGFVVLAPALVAPGLLALGGCDTDDSGVEPIEQPELSPEEADAFRYTSETVEPATYWAALSNLAHAIMFAGLGEELRVSMGQLDAFLGRARFVRRPPMPEMRMVGGVYAAGSPRFVQTPDYAEAGTLRWDPDTFDRTLDPGVQAWALVKITAPEFHIQYHDLRRNKLVALLMLPQARAQAELLERELLTEQGVFAARIPVGGFSEPKPVDQVAVLWAVSSLIRAATSGGSDYWHDAYRDLVDPDRYGSLAERAFAAVRTLPPSGAIGRALGIQALGRFALVATDSEREEALRVAEDHARALAEAPGSSLDEVALSIYGLIEASRLFDEPGFVGAAADVFRNRLLPLWEEQAGAFRTVGQSEEVVYTPFTVGAVVAGLNALRWYGPEDVASEAEHLYPRFFENAVVRSGLLRASPLPLVEPEYLAKEPWTSFAHPLLPDPAEAGVAPVFAGEVVFRDGEWQVTDPMFRTGHALFLSNMLAIRSEDRADPFLSPAGLLELRRDAARQGGRP